MSIYKLSRMEYKKLAHFQNGVSVLERILERGIKNWPISRTGYQFLGKVFLECVMFQCIAVLWPSLIDFLILTIYLSYWTRFCSLQQWCLLYIGIKLKKHFKNVHCEYYEQFSCRKRMFPIQSHPRRSGILLFPDCPRFCRLMKTRNRRYPRSSRIDGDKSGESGAFLFSRRVGDFCDGSAIQFPTNENSRISLITNPLNCSAPVPYHT